MAIDKNTTTFKVNDYVTIKNFVLKNKYTHFYKFGKLEKYQRFNGTIDDNKVKGWLCLRDHNIYKLSMKV